MRATTDRAAENPAASLRRAASPRYPGSGEMGLPGKRQAVKCASAFCDSTAGKEQDVH